MPRSANYPKGKNYAVKYGLAISPRYRYFATASAARDFAEGLLKKKKFAKIYRK